MLYKVFLIRFALWVACWRYLIFDCFCCELAEGTFVGVVYKSETGNPDKVVHLLMSRRIQKVRLLNADPLVLKAFANTGIEVIVGVQNEELSGIGKSISAAFNWVRRNVLPHIPATNITAIAVGNEVVTRAPYLGVRLVQACRNIHAALTFFYLDAQIKVSSPQSIFVLEKGFPPSGGRFNKLYSNSVVQPLLGFLMESGSFFMVNTYPTDLYKSITQELDLNFILMQPNMGVDDPKTGLHYFNMFDASVDAVYTAMAALNYSELQVVVTETAWSSKVDETKTFENAVIYNNNLVRHVRNKLGTPLKPGLGVAAYIHGFLSDYKSRGPSSDATSRGPSSDVKSRATSHLRFHSWKWYVSSSVDDPQLESQANANNMEINDKSSGKPSHLRFHSWKRPESSSANAFVGESQMYDSDAASSLGYSSERSALRTWCVSKPWVSPDALQGALDWACGAGGADCDPIQLGEPCYLPNTIWAHASYAFNSYYQIHLHADGTCDFAGTATIVDEDPSYPGCFYPFRAGQVGAAIGKASTKDSRAHVAMAMAGAVVLLNVILSNVFTWSFLAHWNWKQGTVWPVKGL